MLVRYTDGGQWEEPMDRVTVSLDEELLVQFDDYIRRRGYGNRSEAVRDILRQTLEAERLADEDDGQCVACLMPVLWRAADGPPTMHPATWPPSPASCSGTSPSSWMF